MNVDNLLNCAQHPDKCDGCGLLIEDCHNGGDCLEVRTIYRERQREMLRDIEPIDPRESEYYAL